MSRGFLRLHRRGIAAFGVLFIVLAGCGPKPVGAVLTYQVDSQAVNESVPVHMVSLIDAVNRRIGRAGSARKVDEQRFEVEVYGNVDQERVTTIKRLIGTSGILEFRIIADGQFDADKRIIENAKLLSADETKLIVDGETVAEWLEYSEPEFGPVDVQHGAMVKRLAGDVPQALVLIDPFNVTGEYLTSATMGVDERGNPAVLISFDNQGARRFGMLTGQNIPPATVPNLHRRLGIILDKTLLSAPEIHARISDHARISGSKMTKRDVEFIIELFNAGILPYAVKFVSERRMTN